MADTDVYTRILETAGSRFMVYGFSRTTMDDLATILGMSKKTLYQHFSTKEELVDAVVSAHLERVRVRIDRIFADPGAHVVDRFSAVLATVSREISQIGEPFIADMARRSPGVWQRVEAFRREVVFSRLEGLIRDGIDEGMIRGDVDPRIVVHVLSTAADTLVRPTALLESGFRAADVVRTLRDLLQRGIFTSRGREEMERKEPINDQSW